MPHIYRVEDFAQAIRAIGEPIHARPADQISMAKLLTLLFEVTALFDMTTRIELVMLQKTMVVVEGVARKLDPQLNMWSTAEPVVGAWIAENLGPKGRIEDAGRGARLGSCVRRRGAAPARGDRRATGRAVATRRSTPRRAHAAVRGLSWFDLAFVLALLVFALARDGRL